MNHTKHLRAIIFASLLFCHLFLKAQYKGNRMPGIRIESPATKQNTYYLSNKGNDNNKGDKKHPWKTIRKLNSVQLKPGDSVCFAGGQTFTGTVAVDAAESGRPGNPIVICSKGNNNAIINGDTASALVINNASYVLIRDLNIKGAGRKNGNTKNGVVISNSNEISVINLDIHGFQKAGLLIKASSNIEADSIYAHDNGFAGISIAGVNKKEDCRNLLIRHCKAENNPGDPSNLTNHSGNGIIAGFCKNVTIEYSTATNNGWDMPRKGNGPVGIWCYEADSVVIQHCISYRNKTAAGAADGGGYDFDGGVTNSIIQYCLSYENEGSAFGIFQYKGASDWYNNTVRYNISENDGNVSAAHAGVFVWNGSGDTSQLRDLFFYNNVIYNESGAAISYERESANKGLRFYNNIFVAKDSLITGKETSVVYLANDWYSLSGGFVIDSIKSLNKWAFDNQKERLNTVLVGLNTKPEFSNPGKTTLTEPVKLATYSNYKVPQHSILQKGGINLRATFGIETGDKDFNQQPIRENGIGASFGN